MIYDGPVVEGVLAEQVVVYCSSADCKNLLKTLGGRRRLFQSDRWVIPYKNMEEDLPEIFRTLRDNGYSFLGGPHGWPPAAVFMELRDRGALEGEFQELLVYSPEKLHRTVK